MRDDDIQTAYVVIQQKPLDTDPHVPQLVKWLLRWIYHHYGWAAVAKDGKSYCKLEFIGIFDTATEARWAAMVPGGSYHELPLNLALPEETCQFRIHDFPHSSVSYKYRNNRLAFQAVPTQELERLREAKRNTDEIVEFYHSHSV